MLCFLSGLLFVGEVMTDGATAGNRAGDPQVLAVRASRLNPYDAMLKTFTQACDCQVRDLVLAEAGPRFSISKEVAITRPDAVLVIGPGAVRALSSVKAVPVVITMTLDMEPFENGRENVTGVRMVVDPAEQLRMFAHSVPALRRIGLVYDGRRSKALVHRAQGAAREAGIHLVARKVSRSREVVSAFQGLVDEGVDAFWLLPDATVVNPETIELLFLLSVEHRIPVLSFSKKHVKMGALLSMSVGMDPAGLGRQSASVLKEVLAGSREGPVSRYAKRGEVSVNHQVARKLDISISAE